MWAEGTRTLGCVKDEQTEGAVHAVHRGACSGCLDDSPVCAKLHRPAATCCHSNGEWCSFCGGTMDLQAADGTVLADAQHP